MQDERLECSECGKTFGSGETLREHSRIEHGSPDAGLEEKEFELPDIDLRRHLNRSFLLGLILGLVLSGAAFSGYMYWNSLDHRVNVPVTVVSCGNCSYADFRTATDRMFAARYTEVNYRSERGQQLIEKYNINYVPAFIFDDRVEKAENFYKVKPVLVEFEDAWVVPDRGTRVAQRLSSGKTLEQRE